MLCLQLGGVVPHMVPISGRQIKTELQARPADAAFAKPEIYNALEQRDVDYAIRMPANKNVEFEIEDIFASSAGTAEPQASGALYEFPVSGKQLGYARQVRTGIRARHQNVEGDREAGNSTQSALALLSPV